MPIEYRTSSVTVGEQVIEFKYDDGAGDEVREILTGKMYASVPYLADARTVVDVGSSVGAAAVFFSVAYPAATIYCFEPHPESFEIGRGNTSSLDGIKMFNVGLYDADRTMPLYLGQYTHQSNSLFPHAPFISDRTEEIRLRRASDQLREVGVSDIDVLKIDTEGCEVPILRDIMASYAPKCVQLEYHSEPDRRELDAMLCDNFILCAGRAMKPHLGTLTYLRRDVFPSAADRDFWATNVERERRL